MNQARLVYAASECYETDSAFNFTKWNYMFNKAGMIIASFLHFPHAHEIVRFTHKKCTQPYLEYFRLIGYEEIHDPKTTICHENNCLKFMQTRAHMNTHDKNKL